MFTIGTWVAHRRGGIQGFIVSSGAERSTVEYRATNGAWGTISVDNVNLYKIGEFLTPDELYELIDIALAGSDHEWFVQLWEKRQKASERD